MSPGTGTGTGKAGASPQGDCLTDLGKCLVCLLCLSAYRCQPSIRKVNRLRGSEDAYNGVRNDDVVEIRKLEAQEQQNHQQGMGGCYL